MLEPNGNKHSVAPTYGSAKVPAPEPPTHVTAPLNTRPVLPRMFPVGTPPPAAFTVSLNPVTRLVSWPVSTTFRICAVHVYAFPIFVGLTHCFVCATP